MLARLRALDGGRAAHVTARDPQAVEQLLADIARMQWHWTGRRAGEAPPTAAEVLRGIAEPRRLAAAAAALRSSFPEVAEVLRQAARPDGPAPRPDEP